MYSSPAVLAIFLLLGWTRSSSDAPKAPRTRDGASIYNLNVSEEKQEHPSGLRFRNIDSTLFQNIIFRDLNELQAFHEFKNAGGVMINPVKDKNFAISHYIKDSIHLLILVEIVRIDKGKAKYRALDILEITGLLSEQGIEYGMCVSGQIWDDEIISVFNYTDTEFYTDIVQSWRADKINETIRPISSGNIKCMNEGFEL